MKAELNCRNNFSCIPPNTFTLRHTNRVNTAILLKLITPVTGNVSEGANDILPSINAVLISELLITPLLKFMDISTNLNKHFYAPRGTSSSKCTRVEAFALVFSFFLFFSAHTRADELIFSRNCIQNRGEVHKHDHNRICVLFLCSTISRGIFLWSCYSYCAVLW